MNGVGQRPGHGGGGGGGWTPHSGHVPAQLHFVSQRPVFHRDRFFARDGYGRLFFYAPSVCSWVEAPLASSPDASKKAITSTSWQSTGDGLLYTTFTALYGDVLAQWKVFRNGMAFVWMCNGSPVGVGHQPPVDKAGLPQYDPNAGPAAPNPAVDHTERPALTRQHHHHGAGEPPYTGRFNPPVNAMLRLQWEPAAAAKIAQSLWDGSWPVSPTSQDALLNHGIVQWGPWEPSPAYPGSQYRIAQWANGFFADIALSSGERVIYWAGRENPSIGTGRAAGVGLTLQEGGGIQPPGNEGVVTAGQSSVQAAAHTMNAALGVHGYSINDTGIYQSFQQAAIDAGNLSGTADGFPGQGTMTVLGNVLANMGEAPNWGPGTVAGGPITGYPWHATCASGSGDACYDGVNAPPLSQWNPNAVPSAEPPAQQPAPTPNQPAPAAGASTATSGSNTGLVLLGGAAILGTVWAGYYLYKHGKLSGLATHHRRLTA